jgi:hypothetical protein
MKRIYEVLVVLFVCSISFSASAQKSKLYLESNKNYEKGKIYIKKSLIPIAVTKLVLINDSLLNYTESETGIAKSLVVSTSAINYVKLKTGTKAGEFALWGGAFMGLCGLIGALSAEADYMQANNYESSGVKWVPFVGGFTAGGALVGALIGVFCPKYKNFYIKDNTTTYKFAISPQYFKDGQVGLAMQIKF